MRTAIASWQVASALGLGHTTTTTARPLSPDLTDALHAAGGEPLPVIDPTNQRLYLVVDRDVHERAMTALRRQDAIESIKRGLGGPSLTLEESQRLNLQSLRSHAAPQ